MASVPTITFDGTSLATFGCYLNGPADGWLDGSAQGRSVTALVGAMGGAIGSTRSIDVRRLRLPVVIVATTLAALRANEDTLKAYLGALVTVRIADGANTREIDAVVEEVRLRPHVIPVTLRSDGEILLLCADPLWRATTDTTEAITGTPNALSLGTAPIAHWVLSITAVTSSITDITITLGSSTLTWTGTIASGTTLVINASAWTVENAGVGAIASYSGGFPVLDPLTSPSVSATKASGSGTLSGSLVYRRRYY